MTFRPTILVVIAAIALTAVSPATAREPLSRGTPPADLAQLFEPPPAYQNEFGSYRSPLLDENGATIRDVDNWWRQNHELRREWTDLLGDLPSRMRLPEHETVAIEKLGNLTRTKVRIRAGVGREEVCGYLIMPPGEGPFPAVLVVYYEPESGAGLGAELRDFALQLARRGFVTLSIGPPGVEFRSPGSNQNNSKRPYFGPVGKPVAAQPLSSLAHAAANCHTFLTRQPEVDPNRIGIMGHSFGGKWAMFASCLHEPFACAVWSDPGIVFDERHRTDNPGGSINYWDRWYLGFPLGEVATHENNYRFRPIPKSPDDRTGSYKRLIKEGRDLIELHALMAPRPFLVSGGTADREERWTALNHAIEVNRLFDQPYGVAMSNRPTHAPTEESNEQAYRFLEWCLHGTARTH